MFEGNFTILSCNLIITGVVIVCGIVRWDLKSVGTRVFHKSPIEF